MSEGETSRFAERMADSQGQDAPAADMPAGAEGPEAPASWQAGEQQRKWRAPADSKADEGGLAGFTSDAASTGAATIDAGELAALRNLEDRRKRARRKRVTKIAVVAGVVVVLLVAWFASRAINAASELASQKPETAVVTREDLVSSVQATGTLKAGSQVAVSPEVSGIVKEVRVVEGQQVQAGDVLFTLKNSELEKTLADAGSALDKARRTLDRAHSGEAGAWDAYNRAIDDYNASVDAANEAIANAEQTAMNAYDDAYNQAVAQIPDTATQADRDKKLEEARANAQAAYEAAWATAAAATPHPLDQSGYLSSIDAAALSVETADEALADAQRAYDYAAEQADKRTIRAPISGSVLGLTAQAGAAVGGATGGTTTSSGPLAQIADLSTLSIGVEVNEIDVSNVKPGQRAQITFNAVPGLEIEGKVTSVASIATSSGTQGASSGGGVVTYKAEVTVEEPDNRLKPGMTATVKILTKETPNALVLPASAVVQEAGSSYVMLVTDANTFAAERRDIVVGERMGSQVAVETGLSEGDVVLVGSASGAASSGSASPASGGAV